MTMAYDERSRSQRVEIETTQEVDLESIEERERPARPRLRLVADDEVTVQRPLRPSSLPPPPRPVAPLPPVALPPLRSPPRCLPPLRAPSEPAVHARVTPVPIPVRTPPPPSPASSAPPPPPAPARAGVTKPRSSALRDVAVTIGALVVVAILIALSVIGARSMLAPADDARGSTAIVTVAGPGGRVVPNVTVFADGVAACQTAPCTLSGLEPGVHFVQVTAPGYAAAAARALEVGDGKAPSVHFDLERDVPAAPVPAPVPASPGAVPIAVESLPVAEPEPVAAPAPARAPARAQRPAPVAIATLHLSSTPSANVLVDGRPLGTTPRSARVSPGSHTVLFVHPDHGRAERRVSIGAGASRNVAVRFAP